MQLRYYQKEAIDSIFEYFNSHSGNPLIALPTGTGKTPCIAGFMQTVLNNWPYQRFMVLTHVKELIEQNYKTLLHTWPTAPAGIYSSGLKRKDVHDSIVFGGVASVINNVESFGHRDLLLIDEAHLLSPKDGSMYQRVIKQLLEINPYLKVIGLTATPYRLGQGLLTDDGLFTDICYNKTDLRGFNELLHAGFLCKLVTPGNIETELDVSEVHIDSMGDFKKGELQAAVDKKDVTIKALTELIKYSENRRSWLIFASGIEHSEHISEILNEWGIPTAAVHSKMQNGRDEAIRDFKSGVLRCVVNNNCLCLDEETEILTSSGFVGIDEMSYSHKIAAWNMDGSVEMAYPEFIIKRERDIDEKMVSIGKGGRNAQIRVTANHRMVVSTHKDILIQNKYHVKSAEDLQKLSYFKLPSCGNYIFDKIKVVQPIHKTSRSRHIIQNSYNYRKKGIDEKTSKILATEYVDRIRNLRYKNPDELTSDECLFIGIWLGDGTFSNGRLAITQSMKYADNVKYIDDLIKRIGLCHSKKVYPPDKSTVYENVRWTFARGTGGMGQEVDKGYFSIEPYLVKKGSPYLKGLTTKQYQTLMQGLHMADGNHHCANKNNLSPNITSAHYELCSLLQEIGSLRGFKVTIGTMEPKNIKHSVLYRLTISKDPQWGYTVNSQYEVENEYKKERVWCVTSSTSYLICRRKGKVFVTGNTTGFDHPLIDLIGGLRPSVSPGLHVQMLGRGTRIANGKDNCLVLDFAGNTKRLGPINDPVIPRKKGKRTGTAPIKVCPQCNVLVHASLRICDNCGYEFPKYTKITKTASEAELIRTSLPDTQWCIVAGVYYTIHKKAGRPDSVKVTYQSGLRQFTEYVFPEGIGSKFGKWWKERTDAPMPQTATEFMQLIEYLRKPTQIRVWLNSKYEDILNYKF